MVRPLTDNGFNGGGLVRCDIKLYTVRIIITTELDISQADSIIFGSYQVDNHLQKQYQLLLCFNTQETNNNIGSFAWLCCISEAYTDHVCMKPTQAWLKLKNEAQQMSFQAGTVERKRCWI